MAYVPKRCLLPAILRERKMTAQELADQIGMTKQQISDYSTNRAVMTLKNAKTIASVFQLPIDDLYEWQYVPSLRGRRKNE